MRSSRQPTASAPLIGGKNYRASDDATAKNIINNNNYDEVPLLRALAGSFLINRIGRLQVLQLLLLLGVAGISLIAYSSTTMTDGVGLSAPLGSSAQAVALSAPLGNTLAAVNRTFTVFTCGIPPEIAEKYIPSGWPAICRVKLVGCPGGGDCRHWRYEEGIEMQPTGTARNAFTITTDIYQEGKASTFFQLSLLTD